MKTSPRPPKGQRAEEAAPRQDAEHLARAMFTLGARSAYVIAATGLSSEQVRQWHLRVTGRTSSQGQLPYRAASVIRTRRAQAHASLYAALDRQVSTAGERTIDPWRVIHAFQRYLALVPEAQMAQALNFNHAWVIARDLRAGTSTLVWCGLCEARYLDMHSSTLHGCPICALYAARAGGPRRRRARRFVELAEPQRTSA